MSNDPTVKYYTEQAKKAESEKAYSWARSLSADFLAARHTIGLDKAQDWIEINYGFNPVDFVGSMGEEPLFKDIEGELLNPEDIKEKFPNINPQKPLTLKQAAIMDQLRIEEEAEQADAAEYGTTLGAISTTIFAHVTDPVQWAIGGVVGKGAGLLFRAAKAATRIRRTHKAYTAARSAPVTISRGSVSLAKIQKRLTKVNPVAKTAALAGSGAGVEELGLWYLDKIQGKEGEIMNQVGVGVFAGAIMGAGLGSAVKPINRMIEWRKGKKLQKMEKAVEKIEKKLIQKVEEQPGSETWFAYKMKTDAPNKVEQLENLADLNKKLPPEKQLTTESREGLESLIEARKEFGAELDKFLEETAKSLMITGHKVDLLELYPQLASKEKFLKHLDVWRARNRVPMEKPNSEIMEEYFSLNKNQIDAYSANEKNKMPATTPNKKNHTPEGQAQPQANTADTTITAYRTGGEKQRQIAEAFDAAVDEIGQYVKCLKGALEDATV